MYKEKEKFKILKKKKFNKKKYCILIIIISIFSIILFCLGFSSSYAFEYILYNKSRKQNEILLQSFDEISIRKNVNKKFLKMIDKAFSENHKVNINKIEIKIKSHEKNYSESFKNKIHIAFTLDPQFILETMLKKCLKYIN